MLERNGTYFSCSLFFFISFFYLVLSFFFRFSFRYIEIKSSQEQNRFLGLLRHAFKFLDLIFGYLGIENRFIILSYELHSEVLDLLNYHINDFLANIKDFIELNFEKYFIV